MSSEPTVFVVDDDPALRTSLKRLLQSEAWAVETFADAEGFLNGYDSDMPGVLLLDIKMPGMDGMQLQKHLKQNSVTIPIIMITGHGTVSMSVRAMKDGAVDFVEKPFRAQVLLDRIAQAMDLDKQNRRDASEQQRIEALFERLTPRESEVMKLVVAGNTSKQIADKLEISDKTVALHRAHFMGKLDVSRVADVVRMAMVLWGTDQPE
jgi:two-component system response regulator FixJ